MNPNKTHGLLLDFTSSLGVIIGVSFVVFFFFGYGDRVLRGKDTKESVGLIIEDGERKIADGNEGIRAKEWSIIGGRKGDYTWAKKENGNDGLENNLF